MRPAIASMLNERDVLKAPNFCLISLKGRIEELCGQGDFVIIL